MVAKKSKILKETPPAHVVVPDTNILWHVEKDRVANPEFDVFWDTHSTSLKMELAIPEVVVGELNFQQATSATKLLTKVKDSLKELSGIAGQNHETKLTAPAIKDQVAAKINRWIKERPATVITTPTGEINWATIIDAAIWRTAPFTYDPKNPDVEKGFRDALILETLKAISKKALAEGKNAVFLCKDQLLRNTAVEFFQEKQNVLFFESLKDFEGYIKLTQEKLTNKFVTGIQYRARRRFFTKGDATCLYIKEKVPEKILEKFPHELEPPPSQSSSIGGLLTLGSGLGKTKWELKFTMRWIGSTTFERLQQPRQYFWSTSITVARRYREVLESSVATPLELLGERILLLGIDVKWFATVKADGRFHDLQIYDLISGTPSFQVATPETLKEWGLENTS